MATTRSAALLYGAHLRNITSTLKCRQLL